MKGRGRLSRINIDRPFRVFRRWLIKRVANRGARVLKVGVRAFLSVCERADPRMEVAASFDRGEGIAGF